MNIKSYIIPAVVAAILTTPAWADERKADDTHKNSASITQQQSKADKVEILKEAVQALDKTKDALRQLDDGHKKQALDTLALVTGKLEVLIAQHPDLALAPVAVQTVVFDYIGDEKSVKSLQKEARKMLSKGELQLARHLIKDVASEIVVRVTNLPLATYPQAIKAVVPLIEKGDIEIAKVALQNALSTVVVVDDIIPLPILRAQTAVIAAQDLAKKERDEQENQTLKGLLTEAKAQLEWAQTLGYGDKDSFDVFYDTINDIEKSIAKKGDQQGLFDKLAQRIERLLKK